MRSSLRLLWLLMISGAALAGPALPGGASASYRAADRDGALLRVQFPANPDAGLPIDPQSGLPFLPLALEIPSGTRIERAEVTALDAVPAAAASARIPGGRPVVQAVETGRLGRRSFARLHVQVPGSLEDGRVWRRSLDIRLTLGADPEPPPPAGGRHPFDDLADRLLLPYPLAAAVEPERPVREALAAPELLPARLRIEVESSGLHRVLGSELAAAGVSLGTVAPATLALESGGAPVAIQVLDGGDGTFDAGDQVVFYGLPLDTRFTRRNVYWLSWGGAPGPRMTSRAATPSGGAAIPTSFPWSVHREENTVYTSNPPPGASNHWWWGPFRSDLESGPGAGASLPLTGLSPTVHTIDLRVQIQGRNNDPGLNPDHHTRVRVNGVIADDQTFEGRTPFLHAPALSSSLFTANSTILVDVVGDLGPQPDQVYIDWVEADYRRTFNAASGRLEFVGEGPGTFEYRVAGFGSAAIEVYDVTDPNAPVRLTGPTVTGAGPFTVAAEDAPTGTSRYVAVEPGGRLAPAAIGLSQPVDLMDAANGADHILIAPPQYATAAEPLRAHRAAEGMRAMTVTTRDIFDVFSDGVFDPQAIRDFLAHAYAAWQPPAPAWVVLVGDGTIDFRGESGNSPVTGIPPFLVDTTTLLGEVPSDNTYAMVSGGDLLPDLYLGRLPARNASQVTAMVNKILAYETAPPLEALNDEALFVADNNDVLFQAILDSRINDFLPPNISPNRVYLAPLTPGAAESAAIIAAINGGVLMTTYLGHGNLDNWASEIVLENADVSLLTNQGEPTFVVSMNCINGYFANYTDSAEASLMEALIRPGDRGSIAGWAPSTTTSVSDYDTLSFDLFDNLFLELQPRLGAAAGDALITSISLYGVPAANAQALTFFGDPATRFALDADFDNDGFVGADDCAPADPLTWAVPDAVTGVGASANVALAWDDQGAAAGPSVLYDVIRGSLSQLLVDGDTSGAGCHAPGRTTPDWTDPAAVAVGSGSYYLVRARNDCGDGGYGVDSSNAPRVTIACP